MQILARDQFNRWADQMQVVRGQVFPQIEGAHRQFQLVHTGNPAGVGICLGKIHHMHIVRHQQAAQDFRGCGIAHHKGDVHRSVGQAFGGLISIDVEKRGVGGADAVQPEQIGGETVGSATGRPDGDAFAFKGRKDSHLGFPAIKHKHRHVKEIPQRNEILRAGRVRDAALDEGDADVRFWIAQTREIFLRPVRVENLHGDALMVVRKNVAVGKGILFEHAAHRPATDDDGLWRRGVDEIKNRTRQ